MTIHIAGSDDLIDERPDTMYLPVPLSQIRIEDIEESAIVNALAGSSMSLGQQLQSPDPMLDLTAAQEVFVVSTREAVLSQDLDSCFTKQMITPVVLRDDFVFKAVNFMEMCQGRIQQSGRGHIKIDQAFRSKGSYVEGWIFIRWMEVGWRAAGFKAHRLGSLPLITFHRRDNDTNLQETLDMLMQEVYPVLVECFPECDIVAVQSCEELWNPARTSRVGSELKDALQRAAAAVSSTSVNAGDDGSTSAVSDTQTGTSRATSSLKDALRRLESCESCSTGGSTFGEPQAPVGTSKPGSRLMGASKGHDGGLRLSSTSFTERDDGSVLGAPQDLYAISSPAAQAEDIEAAVCARVEDTNQSQLHCQPRRCSVTPVRAIVVWAAVLLCVVLLVIRLA
jgi:hypothetical protein